PGRARPPAPPTQARRPKPAPGTARPGRFTPRGSRPPGVGGGTADAPRGGGPGRRAGGLPSPVRRAARGRGGARGAGTAGGRLPQLEVRSRLAARGPGKISRKARDAFAPDGAWRADPFGGWPMPADAARAKSLFLAASDLTDPAARAAYLDRECGGDAE